MMATLPRSRLQSSLGAFERAGVDYGGPFLTRQGRGRTKAKRYLSLHMPCHPSSTFGDVIRIRHWLVYKRIFSDYIKERNTDLCYLGQRNQLCRGGA